MPKAKSKSKPAAKAKASPAKDAKRRGRPLASEAHLAAERTKPWKKLKMSRRTYYRRKASGTL